MKDYEKPVTICAGKEYPAHIIKAQKNCVEKRGFMKKINHGITVVIDCDIRNKNVKGFQKGVTPDAAEHHESVTLVYQRNHKLMRSTK